MIIRRTLGHRVKARSEAEIISLAWKLREELRLSSPYVDIVLVYEQLQYEEKLEFEVVEDDKLPLNIEAQCDADRGNIKLKQSVYDAACLGDCRARFTLAHELGHFYMHKNEAVAVYAKGVAPSHEIYEDSEWQADVFGSELLIDSRMFSLPITANEIMKKCGVSFEAAMHKVKKLKRKK